MKRIWMIGVAVALVAAGGVALAQMGPGQPGPGMGPGMMMGGGRPGGQGQQPGAPMGPGTMGPGGQMGPGMMGPGGMMGGGQPGMRGMPGMMMGGGSTNDRPWITVMLDHREELGLSTEQVGRLFTLRDDFAKEARTKGEKLEKAERDLDQLLGPGPVDLRAVETKLREAEAIRTDLRLSRIRVIEEGKGILTGDQWKKFVELVKQPQRSSSAPITGPMIGSQGMEEMQRFMRSDRGMASMNAMMEMARRMGNGDPMLGMTRMMEMMGNMGGMMGTPGQPGRTQ